MIVRLVFLVLVCSFFICGCGEGRKSKDTCIITDFSKLLGPVPQEAIFGQEDYFVWGASVVKGDDELYHMYYSRWPKKCGFLAWLTHSEIAHAVSDKPTGPFAFKDVALPVRGKAYWDGLCTHNPTVHKYNNRYYLYYTGNTGDGIATKSYNWLHRNNQRVGVAWTDDLNSRWNRLDTPLIDVSKDSLAYDALCTNNPSICQMDDGRLLMVYKCVGKKDALPFGGPVSHMSAIAESPIGPFVKNEGRVFSSEGVKFPAEDPFIWFDTNSKCYYAIVKDFNGYFTKVGKSLAFFISTDGTNWKPADKPLVSMIEYIKDNGNCYPIYRLERPQVLIEDGRPMVLYCSVADTTGGILNTYNIHIPLKH